MDRGGTRWHAGEVAVRTGLLMIMERRSAIRDGEREPFLVGGLRSIGEYDSK